jgi:hypothetical protein
MNQYTTQTHLTRTIHRLEHILEANETYPVVRAAELLSITLLELAEGLPDVEQQQVRAIVTLYSECADKEYSSFSRGKYEISATIPSLPD